MKASVVQKNSTYYTGISNKVEKFVEEILPLRAVLCPHADEPQAALAFCTQDDVSHAGPWQ